MSYLAECARDASPLGSVEAKDLVFRPQSATFLEEHFESAEPVKPPR
jgi:hypothetical protein